MAFLEVMRLSTLLLDKFHKTLYYIFCVQCRKPPDYGLYHIKPYHYLNYKLISAYLENNIFQSSE